MDDIPLVAETLDEFLKGLFLLLDDVGKIPSDSWSLTGSPKVADVMYAKI
jgi:hypothetical protein